MLVLSYQVMYENNPGKLSHTCVRERLTKLFTIGLNTARGGVNAAIKFIGKNLILMNAESFKKNTPYARKCAMGLTKLCSYALFRFS